MVSSYLSCAEAALLSGYHCSHIRLLCRLGRIKCKQASNGHKHYEVSRTSLLEYLNNPPKRGPKPENN